jgi:Uma2 family endonuclease
VKQVWIVDAELRRVTINRPDGEAEIFTARHELTAGPELPGFRVPVDSLFPQLPH